MELKDYPQAIATAAQAVNELDKRIVTVSRQTARIEASAEIEISYDGALKNEQQRKAKRLEILYSDAAYQSTQDLLFELQSQKVSAVTHLELLRNQFSVAKLLKRETLAYAESMLR